eukprot:UN28687
MQLYFYEEDKVWSVCTKDCLGTDESFAKVASDVPDPSKIEGSWEMWLDSAERYVFGWVKIREEYMDWEDEIITSDEEEENDKDETIEVKKKRKKRKSLNPL